MDFSQVYEETRELAWKVISGHIFEVHEREDVFQEVYLKVHRALPKFRNESGIKTWVYRIAVNESINHLKKNIRHDKFLSVFRMLRHEETVEKHNFEGFDLEKPLKVLNPKQRSVFVLAEIEERPMEEISQMLKMPVGTVKSNLFRAKEVLKNELEKEGTEKWNIKNMSKN